MALYIRDETVDMLAEQLKITTGAASKTEAVRNALLATLESERAKPTLLESIRELQLAVEDLGPVNPDFDMKKHSDDMWE